MDLPEFLCQVQGDVREAIGDRLMGSGNGSGAAADGSGAYPYAELIFAEIVMEHMKEIGMTFEPEVCHYTARVANATLRISGFALSDDADQLDLFVTLYNGSDGLTAITDSETKTAAEQCLRFLKRCAEGKLAGAMDSSNDAYTLALTIQEHYQNLDQIRIYVLTDRQAKTKNFRAQEVRGKTVKLEVMDIERLHRHWSEGKPRDELVVDFASVSGCPLPCVYVPGRMTDYDYALTVFPGETLRFLYEKYGARLLEANVRSFLSGRGKVNKGISDTLRDDPGRFMAYNNGIVIVADEARFEETSGSSSGLRWLKGMQIVNGGQTTASIYFTKKKDPKINLEYVQVPAKIIILRSCDAASEEALISDVSRCANSQNSVRQSDLSANKPFHIEMEKLALTTYCPDGVGRWFYERAAGSYNTMLALEGTTPARLKHLKLVVSPPSRKITKTDLAKYLNAWNQKPYLVSLGSQKNFSFFMDDLAGREAPLPDVTSYKVKIAKTILFRKAHRLILQMFPAFQGNVAVYLVSMLANRLGERMDFERIWKNQEISTGLQQQIKAWASEVNDVLHRSARGRMISEWAKKPECWEVVRTASYSLHLDGIPEIR
jgi:hypothetical protein